VHLALFAFTHSPSSFQGRQLKLPPRHCLKTWIHYRGPSFPRHHGMLSQPGCMGCSKNWRWLDSPNFQPGRLVALPAPAVLQEKASDFRSPGGDVRNFVCRGRFNKFQRNAFVKRSPNRMANWSLACFHATGGLFQSFVTQGQIQQLAGCLIAREVATVPDDLPVQMENVA
jgi:hypothetical protein